MTLSRFPVFLVWIATFLSATLLRAQIEVPELGACDVEANALAADQIPKALKAWKMGNLGEAKRYLDKAVDFDPRCADARYLLGEWHFRKREFLPAEAQWEQLIALCPDYKAEVYFFLGLLLSETGKSAKGRDYLKKYTEHPDRDPALLPEAQKALEELDARSKLLASPVPFDAKPVPGISTPADEYLGCLSPDMELFFFTRKSLKRDKYAGPAGGTRMVEEFSMARKTGVAFEVGEALPPPFNEKYNEGGPSITADNRRLFFTICQPNDTGYLECDLYTSLRTTAGWSPAERLPEPINLTGSWESQPSVSANGDQLVFASNRAGGMGGLDLYLCKRTPDGSWSAPENLGSPINTSGGDKTPFLHSDSQTLYFSSDGHPGMGAYDLYFSKFDGSVWSKPSNLGYPINTERDNVGLFVSLDGQTAYFSSKKPGAKGDYELYQFELHPGARPEKVALLKGRLGEGENIGGGAASIELKNVKTGEKTEVEVDSETGDYAAAVRLKKGETVLVQVKQAEAVFSARLIDESSVSGVQQGGLELRTQKEGPEFRLNDLRFPTNSAEIDPSSSALIEAFAEYLKARSKLKVEIQGHTDQIGAEADNLELSTRRAKAVYDRLVQLGIPAGRLSYRGYGESVPVASNETEQGRALNRRTVFVLR